jgi:hypothetical protein
MGLKATAVTAAAKQVNKTLPELTDEQIRWMFYASGAGLFLLGMVLIRQDNEIRALGAELDREVRRRKNLGQHLLSELAAARMELKALRREAPSSQLRGGGQPGSGAGS